MKCKKCGNNIEKKVGLSDSLGLFNESSNTNRFIVFLTDGKDNVRETDFTYDSIIEAAKNKGIKIISIGLGSGNDIDEEILNKVAIDTNGKYYHANNAIKFSRYGRKLFDDLN